SRRARERTVPAFKRTHQLLERGRCGAFVPRIAIAGVLLTKNAVELFHRLIKETRRSVNRRGDRDMRAWLFAVARMDRFGMDLQLDFLNSFPLPADTAPRVFQDDSIIQKLLADLIRARKIAALLGVVALGDLGFHFGV